jgi:transposase
MAQAYSDDLRRKLLEAYEAGEGSLAELAVRFRVSVGWAKKISAAMLRTGQMERSPGGPRGRKSRITPAAADYLRERVKQQPDRTLSELREDLWRDLQIVIGITRIWTVLKEMGLRLKKSRSARRNRTVSGSKRSAGSGSRRPVISTRRSLSLSTKAVLLRK